MASITPEFCDLLAFQINGYYQLSTFLPNTKAHFASIYTSDNSLSVLGPRSRKIKKGDRGGSIFSCLFIDCLWGSWKCHMAVYMTKFRWRKIRSPKTFLCGHTGTLISNRPPCEMASASPPKRLSSLKLLEKALLFLMAALIWWLGESALYWPLGCLLSVST